VRPRTAPPANVRQARTRAARVQLRDRQRTHLPGDPEPECRSPGPWLRLRFPSRDDKRGVVRPIEHSLPIPRRQTGSVRLIKPRARKPLLLCGAVRAGIKRSDPCTLTFSSMLAAMIAGASPLCRWLERHLGLRGVAADEMMDRSCSANSSRGWSQQKTAHVFRSTTCVSHGSPTHSEIASGKGGQVRNLRKWTLCAVIIDRAGTDHSSRT
jgi:hypothetical protein